MAALFLLIYMHPADTAVGACVYNCWHGIKSYAYSMVSNHAICKLSANSRLLLSDSGHDLANNRHSNNRRIIWSNMARGWKPSHFCCNILGVVCRSLLQEYINNSPAALACCPCHGPCNCCCLLIKVMLAATLSQCLWLSTCCFVCRL